MRKLARIFTSYKVAAAIGNNNVVEKTDSVSTARFHLQHDCVQGLMKNVCGPKFEVLGSNPPSADSYFDIRDGSKTMPKTGSNV